MGGNRANRSQQTLTLVYRHTDDEAEANEDDRPTDQRPGKQVFQTVVVTLSPSRSTMQVAGFKEFQYGGPVGSCGSFPSACFHRSGSQSGLTLKLVFFLLRG